MHITQQVQQWGNSSGVRLPKKVLEAAHVKTGQEVSISLKGKSIVLTPVEPAPDNSPTLEELLDGITPENVHDEIDWGAPHGKEIW